MDIIISKGDAKPIRVQESGVESEDHLQRYISENPETLPLEDIGEDIHLMVIGREFQTSSGPIDIIAIDTNGEIYVIETKLYKNPDKRLVIAQVLDYGAALWRDYRDPSRFIDKIDAACVKRTKRTLLQNLVDFAGVDEAEAQEVTQAIKTNLTDASYNFLVLMDHLEPQLKDLVLFLNQHSRFSMYAVEMRFYRHEGFQIVIPKVHGAEVVKEAGAGTTSSARRQWDEQSFFQHAGDQLSADDLRAVRELYDASKGAADYVPWGTGVSKGSFNPKFSAVCQRSPYTVWSNGDLSLNFGWLNETKEEEAVRDTYARRLQELGLCKLGEDWKQRHTTVPIDQWRPKLQSLIQLIRQVFAPQKAQEGPGAQHA